MACVLSLPSTDDRSREELSLLELAVSGMFVVGSETKSKNHKKALYKLALEKSTQTQRQHLSFSFLLSKCCMFVSGQNG